jgi:hypothetical protein
VNGFRFVEPVDATVTLWPPPAPADRITMVVAIPGLSWKSRGGPDFGTVYDEPALVVFGDGPADVGGIIEDADGRWTLRTLTIDGTKLDARRFVPQLLRDRIGELARLILEESSSSAPTNGAMR